MSTPPDSTNAQVPKSRTALFSVQVLFVTVLAAALLGLLALWWLGFGLDSGEAFAATLITIVVILACGEFVRRRFRISLKAFFATFTIVAVVMGFFAQRVNNARKQSVVVSLINQLGGEVGYDYNHESDDWLMTNGGILVPTWLRRIFGDDIFARVTFVDLDFSQFQDSHLVGFAHGLQNLEGIHLSGTRVTDQGLKELTNLPKLRVVMLNGDQATEIGVKCLGELPSLEDVVLFGPNVSDQTLKHLKHLPRLRRLTIWETKVTDGGLRHLQVLDELEFLNLNSPQIGDTGIVHVASIPNLRALHFERTAVSDAGIIHLKELQRIERISFFRSSVTQYGVKELREALPGVEIRW